MPVLHLLAGPNGSGKTTFYEHVLRPVTHLPFINADVIAREQWPGSDRDRSYEAAKLAEERRASMIAQGRSFIAETVFSHPSKLDLIRDAKTAGYRVTAHVMLVPLALSMRRVEARVKHGGHNVPLDKQRERYARVWSLVAQALKLAHEGYAYDNSSARAAYRVLAHLEGGRLLGTPEWPEWSELGDFLR